MNPLAQVLTAAMDALRGADLALVGGIAVSARTEPRFTRDLDLAVAVGDDAEAEGLVRTMTAAGFQIGSIIEQDAAAGLATVRMVGPGQTAHGVVADLLFASSGIEPEMVEAAEPLEVFQGVTAPVARIGHLIALKLLARDDVRRPQDVIDLRALVAAAAPADLALARTSAELIVRRGFGRGRDLVALLDGLLAALPG